MSAARAAGHDATGAEALLKRSRWFRDAADAGIAINAGRRGKLQKKRHALAARMAARADDYLRFAHDLRVPFDNYPDVGIRTIMRPSGTSRMSKLRIKVSGCMRSMHGAEAFCAIRSYLAHRTATASAGSTPSPRPPKAAPRSLTPHNPCTAIQRRPPQAKSGTYPVTYQLLSKERDLDSSRSAGLQGSAHSNHACVLGTVLRPGNSSVNSLSLNVWMTVRI